MIKIISSHDWHRIPAKHLSEYLNTLGYESSHEIKNSVILDGKSYTTHMVWYLIKENGNFIVFDFKDHVSGGFVLDKLIHSSKCEKVLRAQYRYGLWYSKNSLKVCPYTYWEKCPDIAFNSINELRNIPKTEEGLWFAGAYRRWRKKTLAALESVNLLKKQRNRLKPLAFLKKLASQKIGLCVRGEGALTHREIECMCCGVPFMSITLRNNLHEYLIPDYHYIRIDTHEGASVKEQARAFKKRYDTVIKDQDFLNYVAKNGMDWYDRNVRFPNSMKLTADLLGIKKKN